MQESPGNLENPVVPRGVGPHGHGDAPRSGDHRRLHKRVGGSLRGGYVNGRWSVAEAVSHINVLNVKCVLTANGRPGTAALSTQIKW